MKFSKSFKLPNLKFYLPLLAASTAAMGGVVLAQASVLAAEYTVATNLSYEQVSQETAIANGINVSVNPGRIAVIDFSTTDEAISYIALGDASRVVYNTDFPIASGTAQTIFLLPIEEIDFPGATTAKITNLVAKTVDAKGMSRVYNFQINHSNSVANLGIKITPQIRNRIANRDRQVIKVSYGRAANLNDVERGLKLAIDRGFTKPNDPVVTKVKRFVAKVRNGDLSVVESAQSVDIDIAVISSLAEMALEQFSFVKQDGGRRQEADGRGQKESCNKTETYSQLKNAEYTLGRGFKLEKEQGSKPSALCPKTTCGEPNRLCAFPGGNKIQQKFPSVPSTTKSSDDDRAIEKPKAIDRSAAIIPDSNKKPQVESKSEDSIQTVGNTTETASLIDPNEDLSVYLTKVPSVPLLAKKASSEDDERVENALKAHDLYFGWQRVVRQGILDLDDGTEDKVNRAISLVRRGTPIKSALKDAQLGIQVSSFLLAISTDDTEALASLSANVARAI
ncbi:hypothetical protein [Pleurocapsa sp. PCC 7319]|uniref:hypothetical protein n=1 Tax=Pleurocapsa sp. PCC 7319 TaxID=118161 RepID=UPI00034D999B|nr:hypothetical protein [Pleurocapsa sp. PCC 7319]